MGTVDYNRIHIRYINSGFDDGCSNKHIVFIINKLHNHFFRFIGGHLSVANCYTTTGHQAFDHRFNHVDILNTVIDKENLSVPFISI